MTTPLLLTGASGYIGGRLLKALEARGCRVRCLARQAAYLEQRVQPGTEIVEGDVFNPQSLDRALEGVECAYYLIHSMGAGESFEAQDREGARNFAEAAERQGVRRIIYLGGLAHGDNLSVHLRSRHEVGRLLRESGVPTLELRASIIIGSGSLSFELIRALVDRLPIMITPRWVRTRTQPVAIEDVIAYLVESLDLPLPESCIYEIGGTDRMSYRDLMHEYARQRGLRRIMIPVPVLTPYLSSRWLGLVTPVYARVGRQLIDGLRNETIVRDERALHDFSVRPRSVKSAIERALVNEDQEFALTRWSDALSAKGPQRSWAGLRFGARIVDSREIRVPRPPAQAFAPIRRIGGATGWYYGNVLWRIRGFLDLLVGGVGLRRGRRDPEHVIPGDALDFWRVERVIPDSLLRLHAEMKLPGRAWLQFEVEPTESGSVIRQTALFDPRGLSGLAYWYALYPIHALIFRGMLRRIARTAAPEERD